jgi:VanZ family protein
MSSQQHLPGVITVVPDKLGHSSLYGVFGVFIVHALTKPRGLTKISRGLLAVGLAAFYGATDEWHQSFVPGRTAEWADLLADFTGAALGVSAYLFILGRKRETGTNPRG